MQRHGSHFSSEHYEAPSEGPFSFLNPTTRRRPIPVQLESQNVIEGNSDESTGADPRGTSTKDPELRAAGIEHKWRSRDNRKGRHTLEVTPATNDEAKYLTPPPTNTLKAALKGIWRMFSTYPYWDVSYLVAVIFTLGSVIWVFNAFFVWLPLQDPSTEFDGEVSSGGGITAFIGATIFEFGSILLMLEAVNENQSDCFGWAIEEAFEGESLLRLKPDLQNCSHHHRNKSNFVGKGKMSEGLPSNNHSESKKTRKWTWWPTWHEITSHYLREIGFLACLSQFLGASIFWIAGFTSLPGIFDMLSPAALDGAYWAPQVVGGFGFIVSGTLFVLETQQKWYLPAPKVLGWHIGIWNLLGGIGFCLCGCLGYSDADAIVYESSLATFWGSWCFLIGSVIQWFESLDKHPVDVEEGGGRVSDTQPVKP